MQNEILIAITIGLGISLAMITLLYFRSVRHWDEYGNIKEDAQ